MNIYDLYLASEAKTQPHLTIFEHSSDVLQVANYLLERNSGTVQHPDLVRVGALAHDVGKIERDFRSGQWIHAPHSAKYLGPLLEETRFHSLMEMAGIDLAAVDRDLLLTICEEHHNPTPKLLRRCKDAILVSLADALASSIESGTVGNIATILRSNPYLQVSLELVRSLGFDKGFDTELHRVDLPGRSVEDQFLASMIFCILANRFSEVGIYPLLQKGASLWVAGKREAICALLSDFAVDPKQLYDSVFDEGIYDSVLAQFPPGAMQIDILRFLLVNEPIARKMAIALYSRDKPRKLLEKHNLSHLAERADELFVEGLQNGIDALWCSVRLKLLELAPDLDLPLALAEDVGRSAVDGKRQEHALFAKPKAEERKSTKARKLTARAEHNREVLRVLTTRDKKLADDVEELLKLFDWSQNAYRSLTNILLESIKMQAYVAAGTFALPLAQVALLNGQPLAVTASPPNAELCPVCQRFAQEVRAPTLITGRSEGDSNYYTFKQREGAISICRWCFIVGYVDLPIASFVKEGQSVIKGREYLLLTSPLPKEKLQRLVDFVRQGRTEVIEGGDQEESTVSVAELAELQAMMGVAGGYDELAVLGISRQRLSYLKGFVLPMVNVLSNLVGIRVPAERLVGEDKVSGAVHRELVKATMHDLHLATGAISMHYNVVAEAPFSVPKFGPN